MDLEILLRRIREDVQHRRAAMGERPPVDAARSELPQRRRRRQGAERAADLHPLPWLAEFAGIIERKQKYSLEDFLYFNDEDFIRNAYRGVLRREADADGSGPFLEGLRTGHMAKSEILGRLRYSAEGRACGVPIRGLLLAFALRTARHAPLIGRLLGIAQYVIHLPEIVRNHERLEAQVFHLRFELARGVNTLGAQIDDRQARIATSVDRAIESLDATIAELQERQEVIAVSVDSLLQRQRSDIQVVKQAIQALQNLSPTRDDLAAVLALVHEGQQRSAELRTAIDSLRKDKMDRVGAMDTAHKTDTALAELHRAVSASQSQLAAMEAAAEAKESALAELRLTMTAVSELEDAEAHLLDPFYVALEYRFRGTHEDIKNRVATHLPIIHAAGAGTADAPIVDIGCGRGEWLELLREQDLVARGVDLNHLMIEKCRARGLDVTAVDAIDYLRGAAADSLGAVTGIHIIEHLSFRQLIRLIDETYRALRAGGVAIFETPNPENLIVGACNFWYDPTHHKPLPPELMRFIFEARAFTRVEVIRLHPFPYELHLSEGPVQVRSRLNELLYGWQDYAIVAHKD